jgi:hypothetical protein
LTNNWEQRLREEMWRVQSYIVRKTKSQPKLVPATMMESQSPESVCCVSSTWHPSDPALYVCERSFPASVLCELLQGKDCVLRGFSKDTIRDRSPTEIGCMDTGMGRLGEAWASGNQQEVGRTRQKWKGLTRLMWIL